MCGIVGYVGPRNASDILLDGLRRLEYRGYDSAGMVVLTPAGFDMRRSVGKMSALESVLQKDPLKGSTGIGHIRWATHGRPSEENAHPHRDCSGRVAVVHNGIIENHASLKAELKKRGHTFSSQTDTEVVAHLIEEALEKKSPAPTGLPSTPARGGPPSDPMVLVGAVRAALSQIKGSYALGVLCSDFPDTVVGARRDCPLILGLGEKECFLASDVPAILPHTREAVYLDEGEVALLTSRSHQVFRQDTGAPVSKKITRITWDPLQAEKSGYRHFMLKEIYEQPRAIEDTLLERLNLVDWQVYLDNVKLSPAFVEKLRKVVIVACGTSWHAAHVGKYLIESWGQVPCEVDIASEFRYRDPLIGPEDLLVVISQSGETADTIAALRHAKSKGARTLAIVNGMGSTIAREADGKIYTRCGPEIGVASTKAFTGQLTVLYLLALYGALIRGVLPKADAQRIMQDLLHLPRLVDQALKLEPAVAEVAKKFAQRFHFLFLGRHFNAPIALEGALKLKEISYIHAEGYPAGEMKHGPIALIDEKMPVFAIATQSRVYDKMITNIEEIKARGGNIIALATEGDERVTAVADHVFYLPPMAEFLTPCVNIVPLQLFAYHVAVQRGCDVDQPRNLAKSVTVE